MKWVDSDEDTQNYHPHSQRYEKEKEKWMSQAQHKILLYVFLANAIAQAKKISYL